MNTRGHQLNNTRITNLIQGNTNWIFQGNPIKYKGTQIKYNGIQIENKGTHFKYKGIQIKYKGRLYKLKHWENVRG